MLIIPVIDLLDGQVVHAKRGERTSYQPLESRLCHESSPVTVVEAFLRISPFDLIYIADLNAIQSRGNNRALIQTIRHEFPHLGIWLDNGISSLGKSRLSIAKQDSIVIGSETHVSSMHLKDLKASTHDFILSLDFHLGDFLGEPDVLADRDCWPEKIILMNLDRVGTNQGYDQGLLEDLLTDINNRQIFVAGGIHREEQLFHLEKLGIKGVLVATALHSGDFDGKLVNKWYDYKKMPRIAGHHHSNG